MRIALCRLVFFGSLFVLLAACSGSGSSSPMTGSGSGGSSSGGTGLTDVLTYHYDNTRSGQNLTETTLTPSNVKSATFGLLRTLPADGLVDAAPLIATAVTINGSVHNVVYIATENDSVYAYDADTDVELLMVSLLPAGESPSDVRNCNQVVPQIGITATPVIDRSAGANGTMYVVAMSVDGSGGYHQRLHALDLSTLTDRLTPVAVQAAAVGSSPAFAPGQYKERSALLLVNGQIFTTWASHCDDAPYNGWIIAYSESALSQTQVLNLTPNGSEGAIWHVSGPATDSNGFIYVLMANGTFDTTLVNGFPNMQDYGNAAVKLSLGRTNDSLAVADYFTMDNTVSESTGDVDLGSGSPLVIPDQVDVNGVTHHLLFAAGKDGNIYLLNRDNMGKFNSATDGQIYQFISFGAAGSVFSAPVYFNGSVYLGAVGNPLQAFQFSQALLRESATSQSSATFDYPGTSASISANGTSNAIVWAINSTTGSASVLHAYNPANLANEYYNSTQAAGNRDAFGQGNKYITPVVANGKVFVSFSGSVNGGPANGVAVFGLLH